MQNTVQNVMQHSASSVPNITVFLVASSIPAIGDCVDSCNFSYKAVGSVVCAHCSSHRRAIPKFGYDNPIRCCDTCDVLLRMQQMNSNGLLEMPLKQLRKYIRAYNLSSKTAIEKGDLVRIIMNTRPISNESEMYYRDHRHEHSGQEDQELRQDHQSSPGEGEGVISGGISQVFNELFGNTSRQGKEQRKHEQEEQRRRQQQRQRMEEEHLRRRQLEEEERQRRRQQQVEEERQRRDQEEQRRRQQQQQQQQQRMNEERQRRQQSRPAPSVRKDDMLSLDDMIRSDIDPNSLSIRTLKAILKANFVNQSHALEKSDLVVRVHQLADERRKELSGRDTDLNEDSLCRICCDAQQNCVFLDCGHMATCMDCGKQLVASKNECPICREPIIKLVHVFRS